MIKTYGLIVRLLKPGDFFVASPLISIMKVVYDLGLKPGRQHNNRSNDERNVSLNDFFYTQKHFFIKGIGRRYKFAAVMIRGTAVAFKGS